MNNTGPNLHNLLLFYKNNKINAGTRVTFYVRRIGLYLYK